LARKRKVEAQAAVDASKAALAEAGTAARAELADTKAALVVALAEAKPEALQALEPPPPVATLSHPQPTAMGSTSAMPPPAPRYPKWDDGHNCWGIILMPWQLNLMAKGSYPRPPTRALHDKVEADAVTQVLKRLQDMAPDYEVRLHVTPCIRHVSPSLGHYRYASLTPPPHSGH